MNTMTRSRGKVDQREKPYRRAMLRATVMLRVTVITTRYWGRVLAWR